MRQSAIKRFFGFLLYVAVYYAGTLCAADEAAVLGGLTGQQELSARYEGEEARATAVEVDSESDDESDDDENEIQVIKDAMQRFLAEKNRLKDEQNLTDEAARLQAWQLEAGKKLEQIFIRGDGDQSYSSLIYGAIHPFEQDLNQNTYLAAMEPLLLYVQGKAGRAKKLLKELDWYGHDSPAVLAFLQRKMPEIREQVCAHAHAKENNLLPPLYGARSGEELSEDDQLLSYAFVPSIPPQGASKSIKIPFKEGHLPVLWLEENKFIGNIANLKESDCGKEINYKGTDPLYAELTSALCYSRWLIVASRALNCALFSFIYGKKSPIKRVREEQEKLESCVAKRWAVYQVPDSQYYVWIPKKYEAKYADIVNINQFTLLKAVGRRESHEYIKHREESCPTWFVKDVPKKVRPYSEDDLKKIFKPYAQYTSKESKKAVLDFMISGHGTASEPPVVAGISVGTDVPEKNRLTSFLTYLNDNLSIGTVAITSCSAGGSNKPLLEEIAAGVPLQYHYNLVLNSISDKPTPALSEQIYPSLQNYFANAALLERGWINIRTLCEDLYISRRSSRDFHGFANLPQVLLPGGHSFTGCGELEAVLEVSHSMIESGQPIKIRNKEVVLWHGADIANEVTVYPLVFSHGDTSSFAPPIVGMQDEQLQGIRFPEFISMMRMKPILHFKSVNIEDQAGGLYAGGPYRGVLHFLRDAFFDVGAIAHETYVVIDKLYGINDVPRQIQKAQGLVGINIPDEFAKKWQSNAGQEVTFENVFITIAPMPEKGSKSYIITLVMSDPEGGQWESQFLFQENVLARPEFGKYHWHFKRKDVKIPTVESVKERLPSEGSQRFRNIKKILAGKLEQIEELQESALFETEEAILSRIQKDFASHQGKIEKIMKLVALEMKEAIFSRIKKDLRAGLIAFERSIRRIELDPFPSVQLDNLKKIIDEVENSTGKSRDSKVEEFMKKFRDILRRVPAEKDDQLMEILKRELVRTALQGRKPIRETIAAKMDVETELKKEIDTRFAQAIFRIQTDASKISEDDFTKFGAEALRAATSFNEALQKDLKENINSKKFKEVRDKFLIKEKNPGIAFLHMLTSLGEEYFKNKLLYNELQEYSLPFLQKFLDELAQMAKRAPKDILKEAPSPTSTKESEGQPSGRGIVLEEIPRSVMFGEILREPVPAVLRERRATQKAVAGKMGVAKELAKGKVPSDSKEIASHMGKSRQQQRSTGVRPWPKPIIVNLGSTGKN